MTAVYKEISRDQINQFLACALRRATARHGFDVLKSEVNENGNVRLDLDNGDIVLIDIEHLVPRTGAS